jgi:hypothetical protein
MLWIQIVWGTATRVYTFSSKGPLITSLVLADHRVVGMSVTCEGTGDQNGRRTLHTDRAAF